MQRKVAWVCYKMEVLLSVTGRASFGKPLFVVFEIKTHTSLKKCIHLEVHTDCDAPVEQSLHPLY